MIGKTNVRSESMRLVNISGNPVRISVRKSVLLNDLVPVAGLEPARLLKDPRF